MAARLAFALFLALSGCAGVAGREADGRPLPAFPRALPPAPGEERIQRTARGAGYLAWQGWCLGISAADGSFTTFVWPHTARLERDRRGIVVRDGASGARIRVGDYFEWGGGAGPAPPAAFLSEPVRPECAARTMAIDPGFRRARPPR